MYKLVYFGDTFLLPSYQHVLLYCVIFQNVVSELDAPAVVQILMTILYEAALPSVDFTKWPSQSWGRVEGM